MRLWFQVLSSNTRMKDFIAAMQAQCQKVAAPGTTVEVHGTTHGAYADDHQFFVHYDLQEVYDNALRIRKEGSYDAFVLANSLDPGLVGLREIMNIPVVSLMEVSCFSACMMGETFGVVVPNEKFLPRYREIIIGYGLRDRLAGVEAMKFDSIPAMNSMFTGNEAALDQSVEVFLSAARRLVDKGAEVVFGAGPPITAAAMRGVHTVDGALVLDGYSLLVKYAEAMVAMHRLTGEVPVSRKNLYRQPSKELLVNSAQMYNIDTLRNG